jgi:uncharacterized membrane protein YbhN (UPF0104 family)
MNRSALSLFIKLALTVGLSALIIRKLELSLVFEAMQRITSVTIILSCVLIVLSLTIATGRWKTILECNAPLSLEQPSFYNLWRLMQVGFFFGQGLPSSIGGDAYRAIGLNKYYKGKTSWVVSSVIIERIHGLIALCCLGCVAIPFEWEKLNSETSLQLLTMSCVAVIVGAFFSFIILKYAPLPNHRYLKPIRQFFDILKVTMTKKQALIKIFFYSFTNHIALIFVIKLLAVDLGIDLNWKQLTMTIPAVFLFSALPISFAGWGLREGAMIVALQVYNVPKETAITISLLYGIIQIFASLPGLILWVTQKKTHIPIAQTS